MQTQSIKPPSTIHPYTPVVDLAALARDLEAIGWTRHVDHRRVVRLYQRKPKDERGYQEIFRIVLADTPDWILIECGYRFATCDMSDDELASAQFTGIAPCVPIWRDALSIIRRHTEPMDGVAA